MATKKTKPFKEVKTTIQEDVVIPESGKKEAFRALLEKYKKQNPAKYALKRESLEEQLNEMN